MDEVPELLDLALELVYSAGLPDLTAAIAAAADLLGELGELGEYGAAWDAEAA